MLTQTVTITQNSSPNIIIGRRSTYETQQVIFDVSWLVQTYGEGTAELLIKRPKDASAYPVVAALDGNTLIWTVSETDTQDKGHGECEIYWYVNGGLAKSCICGITILRDIGDTTETAPDPYETWVDELARLGAETLTNAQAAEQSANNAAQSASEADNSAAAALESEENALNSENAAKASEQAAAASEQGAEQNATAARQSATEAAQSATNANDDATNASASADRAEQAAASIEGDTERAEAAARTAQDAASDASGFAGTASTKATEAAGSAATAEQAANTATQKASDASASATAAGNSANAAAGSATDAYNSASAAASSATAASNAQTAAETAQGKAEDAQEEAEAAASSLSASAAQIATNAADISDLKSFLNDFGNDIASDFSTSKAYNTGEYVIYSGVLYRFVNYHAAGNWKQADAQSVSVTDEIYPLLKYFEKGFDKISIITGYNISVDGPYHPVTYASYCVDQESYFKVADNATTISIAGNKSLFVRFYDEDLKALGNGGQTTASNYTVNILAADNPNLERDAKWVKFGGQPNFNEITFTNLIPGRFVSVAERLNSVNETLDSVNETLDSVVNYRTITQTDMLDGYIVQSNGVKNANANYVYIENVPVIPGQTIVMTAYFGGSALNSGGISGYDVNGNFKQRVFDGPINGNPDESRTQYVDKKITIPNGVYYIAFSTRKDGSSPIKLQLNTVLDTSEVVSAAVEKHEVLEGKGVIFNDEVKASIESMQTVLANSGKRMLTMAVFTDLHHDPKYTNDPTRDMMANINAIYDRIHFDALMNLGDAIDGQYQTQYQAEGCLSEVVTGMYAITDRSHNLCGNHDDNVQSTWDSRGGQPASERLTLLEVNDVLFKGSGDEVHNPNHITDYYIDFDEYDIRVICVGIDYTAYNSNTQTWLSNTALQTAHKVLVLSHCATKAQWGYMNDISNGQYVETPLNTFVSNGGTVIAFIHGHTHGDMIETDSSISFTEVAIGCAKFEILTSGTTGITYQPRNADDYTKILFDLVCIDQTNRKVHFIRCGAGSDRVISY